MSTGFAEPLVGPDIGLQPATSLLHAAAVVVVAPAPSYRESLHLLSALHRQLESTPNYHKIQMIKVD